MMHIDTHNPILTAFISLLSIEVIGATNIELVIKLTCQVAVTVATVYNMWKTSRKKD